MNKQWVAGVLASSMCMLACEAEADTLLGVYAGADVWNMSVDGGVSDSSTVLDFNYAEETQNGYYLALEHFIPLVPNVKIRQNPLVTTGSVLTTSNYDFNGESFTANTELNSQFDVTNTDLTLYYEILDFEIMSLDLGVNVKHLDGDILVASADQTQVPQPVSFSGAIPMAYGKFEVGIPLTGFGAFVEANMLAVGDHSVQDYRAAITYQLIDNLAVDVELQLGYRAISLEIEDLDNIYSDLELDGVYSGIQIHF